jgi:hypothetical protein
MDYPVAIGAEHHEIGCNLYDTATVVQSQIISEGSANSSNALKLQR